jgi:hypothetical protein
MDFLAEGVGREAPGAWSSGCARASLSPFESERQRNMKRL